ncbi:MAG: hypothetical protein ACR2LN_00680 [Candidatus Levyibacteriota bacterium]
MAVETPTGADKLHETFVNARIAEYVGDRRESIGTSKLLKTLGFLGTVAGAGLLLAGHAYAPFLAAATIGQMIAAGKVSLYVGAPVMLFGAIKEAINRKTKP